MSNKYRGHMNEKHEEVSQAAPHDSKHCKLLDMLYGWANQLDEYGEADEAEKIANLYQMAGNMDLGEGNTDNNPRTDEFIADFITNEVLPVILGRK